MSPPVFQRAEWNLRLVPPGAIVEGRGKRWRKVGRGLQSICLVCGLPVSMRHRYCRDHRPRKPPSSPFGETRESSRRRREELLQRLIQLLQWNPEATNHDLDLEFPGRTLPKHLIPEARRQARAAPLPSSLPVSAVEAEAASP